MKITLDYAAIGKAPEAKFIGKNSTLLVTFPIAENINVNKGTKDEPDWQTVRTNWYNVSAWEDVAQNMLSEKIDKGDIISFSGTHEVKKIQNANEEAKYINEYTIREYKLVKKSSNKSV